MKSAPQSAPENTSQAPVAVLGGTFDPIHLGHTQPVLELADRFGWSHVHVQPCFAPPHRQPPHASDAQRMRMVELACQQDARLIADDFELKQQRPTRTHHTLQHLRHIHPHSALCFIMGMDSFLNFTSWLNWQGILQLAHIIVLPRPGYDQSSAPMEIKEILRQHQSQHISAFHSGAGKIYIAETNTYPVSATELRTQLATRSSSATAPCPALLSPQVFSYIQQHQLYLS